ncbi:tetratricopeptide repeat protein [Nostoc sp.]|uniref:tetratricopeptide repeat protein n=1 Tax=Nostoc sp. TaxID=1180 RepID=UPI002FF7BFCA
MYFWRNLAPEFDTAYNNRGLARFYLGDKQGALQDYNKAIQLNAKKVPAYFNRAFVRRYDLGDNQGAIKDWQQAANLYLEQGDTKKYLEAIEEIKLIQ